MPVQSAAETRQVHFAKPNSRSNDRLPVDIVLAGDAHGAFAWGVLDRLLDDPNVSLSAITASGFGAAEAAVLAYGLAIGGTRGAQMALANFWRRVSHASMSHIDRSSLLRSILEQSTDIERIRSRSCPVMLSILATNARTDALRAFCGKGLSINAIVAAMTVPFLFPAVEVDGDSYWGDCDLSQMPAAQAAEARHQLIISARPSVFTAPCPDHDRATNGCAIECAPVHTIFDTQHRRGATLFLRPWVDWGELTDMRDRGRQRAGDWLAADLWGIDECPTITCASR
ncbi:hypothetical protein EN817_25255 [Mesorhizobium sp. M3A.F.Ca.ET.174.01.1.1]|uniref:patatin-like phospholipase family protein n=1 Tax=unclassified Mesorhizobium TaxID=325217 RepID=UPI001093F075|nr:MULTISPECIES: hypothetical protein [unclassified Mesorhizobium]TGS64986.1 hypothetical protein EN844_20090 [Mesorhizobium sp. M3A.F.Ca.ET.201.01.1.1]TGS82752.1 hypothetical protein EN818_25305 [Mesorhizobium sp. M3A.F.Ca.ET.175.01.1.1]TGT22707.1 hypothetical protein EN817_25255 [Mesorhizobium sp. M3A.F.Ca.ET.174.01.1.1]